MRRCKDIQGGGLILAVCLCAGVALADVWPSWLSPAQGSYDRGNQALSGAVERLTVSVGPDAWTNYITTNIWASYFSQAAKLKASKAMFKAAVDTGIWTRPATNWTPETAETVTASNLLAWCGAPSGWWTNHPYVNIAAVSNGWRFLPDVASNLVWAVEDFSGYQTETWYGTSNSTGVGYSWWDATGKAANVWAYNTNDPQSEIWIGRGTWGISNSISLGIRASAISRAAYKIYQGFSPYSFDVDVYTLAFPLSGFTSSDTGSNAVFDSQESNIASNWTVHASFIVENASVWTASVGKVSGGLTNNPSLPMWCSPPYSSRSADMPSLGWEMYGIDGLDVGILQRYNATTNGFRWFR